MFYLDTPKYDLILQEVIRELRVPGRGKVGSRANRTRHRMWPRVLAETNRRFKQRVAEYHRVWPKQ